jgi:hypothetical protein
MSTLDSLDPPAAAPRPRAALAALAAAGVLVPALILAATGGPPYLLAAVPAVTFGIPALTAPALYVGITLVGGAPPLLAVVRAIGRTLLALAIMQLGLAVPAAFLVATASPATADAIVALAVAMASAVAVIRLRAELTPDDGVGPAPDLARVAVEWIWVAATIAIVARTYADVVGGAP